jgi:hypothetical protein
MGVVGIDISKDQVDIFLVAKDNVIERLQGELSKFNSPTTHFFNFIALFSGDTLRETAWNGSTGVYFPTADHFNNGMTIFAHLDDLTANLKPNFMDDTQDIPFSYRCSRTHDEIGACQGIEVGGMVGAVESHIKQLTQHLGGAWWIDMVNSIYGFCTCHVMSLRADTTDTVGEDWYFLYLSANAEALETAQFGDLEVGIGEISLIIEENFDFAMAFQPGDRVYRYSLHKYTSGLTFPRGFAEVQQRTSQIEAIKLPGWIRDAFKDTFNFSWIIATVERRERSRSPTAGCGPTAEHTLFKDTQLWINHGMLDTNKFLDLLLVTRARTIIAHG